LKIWLFKQKQNVVVAVVVVTAAAAASVVVVIYTIYIRKLIKVVVTFDSTDILYSCLAHTEFSSSISGPVLDRKQK